MNLWGYYSQLFCGIINLFFHYYFWLKLVQVWTQWFKHFAFVLGRATLHTNRSLDKKETFLNAESFSFSKKQAFSSPGKVAVGPNQQTYGSTINANLQPFYCMFFELQPHVGFSHDCFTQN